MKLFESAARQGNAPLVASLIAVCGLFGGSAAAGPNAANSSLIPDEYQLRYFVTPTCQACHGSNSSARPNDPDGNGTAYGRSLDQNMPFATSGGVSIPNSTIQRNGFDAVESFFAPRVTAVNGLAFSGGAIALPGAQSALGINFDAGRNFDGAPGTITSLGAAGDIVVTSPAATAITVSLSSLSLFDRGERRRLGVPFDLSFSPVNSVGFRNTSAANRARNEIAITFDNIAPTGAVDSFLASQANDAGNPLAMEVLNNDDDPDGLNGDLTAVLVSDLASAAEGTLTLNAAGTGFLYVVPAVLPPVASTVSFQYAPVDGEGLQGGAVTVTINLPAGPPPATPPVANDDGFSFDEDTVLAGDVKADNGSGPDTDAGGLGSVTFSVLNAPARGALAFAPDGTFTYTPVPNDSGALTFEYIASDGDDSDQALVTLNILPLNDAPSATADNFLALATNTAANQLALPVLANDTDIDSPAAGLRVVLVSGLAGAEPGTLTLNAAETGFLYAIPDPLPLTATQVTFQYAPVDDQGLQGAPVTVTITRPAGTPPATPPVANDDAFSFDEDTVLAGDVKTDNGSGPDSDPDGLATLSFSVLNPPALGALAFAADGTFTYTPAANDTGTQSFEYLASDGTDSDAATVTLTIRPVGDAPVGTPDNFLAAANNDAANKLALPVLANDTDIDSPLAGLRVVLISGLTGDAPGILEIDGAGTGFLYTIPDPLPLVASQVTFQYAPVDDMGEQGAPVTVTINRPAGTPVPRPPVANDDLFSIDEDTVLSGNVAADNGNGPDSDPDGLASVTFSVLTAPASGVLSLAADGSFTYTPVANATGTVSFAYLASDGTAQDSATVTVTLRPVNDAPVAQVIALPQRDEAEANFAVSLLDSAFVTDVDGDTLAVSNVTFALVLNETDSKPVEFTEADLYAVSGPTITFAPTEMADLDNDESVDITVTYDISDGTAPLVTNRLTLRITGLDNGLGRLAGLYADQISSRYNGHFGGINQANGSCHTCHLPGQVDADVDTVDECLQSPPVFNAYGLQLCLNRDANTPALADLRRRMSEAEPDFAPRLMPSPRFVLEETAVPGDAIGAPLTLASRGKTVQGRTSDIVEYLIVANGGLSPTDENGQFTVDPSGQMRVAPGADLTPGTYSFVILPVNDAGQRDNAGNLIADIPGFFPFDQANQTAFTVEVLAILPQAVADSASTLADTPVTVNVTANDTAGAPTSLTIATAPTNGTATINNNLTVTYSPAPGFSGTDSFAYVAANNLGSSDPATVTIAVFPSGAVAAQADSAATIAGAPVTIDVLANDPGAVRTASGATVVQIIGAVDPAGAGSLAVSGQSVVFTPAAGFTGIATARYSAANAVGPASQATITLDVLPSAGTTISDTLVDPELKKVAQAFEQSCGLTDDAAFLSACVNLLSAASLGEDLSEAMRALRNEEHFATFDVTRNIARGFGRGLDRRIDSLRAGGVRGFDISGFNVSVDGQSIPSQLFTDLYGGVLGLTQEEMAARRGWGFFMSGDLSFSEKDGATNSGGFETTAGHLLFGLDFELGARSSIGFALGYTAADTGFGGGGSLDTKAVQASLYGRVDDAIAPGIDFDAYLSIGKLDFISDRRILFTANGVTTDAIANAQFDGAYVNIVPTLSFSETLGRYGDPLGDPKTGTSLRWFASLDYLAMRVGGYSETGGAGLALSTQAETYESLLLEAGVDLSRPIWISAEVPSEIRAGLSLRSELLDDTRSVTSSFNAAGAGAPSFTVTEPGSKGLGARLDLGTTLALEPGELTADYSLDYSSGGQVTHSISLGFSQSFDHGGALNVGVQRNFVSGVDPSLGAEARYQLRF